MILVHPLKLLFSLQIQKTCCSKKRDALVVLEGEDLFYGCDPQLDAPDTPSSEVHLLNSPFLLD